MIHRDIDVKANVQAIIAGERLSHPCGGVHLIVSAQLIPGHASLGANDIVVHGRWVFQPEEQRLEELLEGEESIVEGPLEAHLLGFYLIHRTQYRGA